MSYHDLSECTLTDEERLAEGRRIYERLKSDIWRMKTNEATFAMSLRNVSFLSVKQLFYARDLNERY